MAGPLWPGLLAWSTKYHDGTAPSQFSTMSDEDRKFLERAMEDAFGQIEDPNKVMAEAVGMITAEDRTAESVITALEVLDRCCDDPDCARNADKLGAIQALLDVLKTYPGEIRMRATEFFSLICSNNPTMQKAGVEKGGTNLLLELVREAEVGSEEKMKSFRALVSMTRNVEEYETMLLRDLGGAADILACMAPEEDPRTREKAMSFVRSLAANNVLSAEEVTVFIGGMLRLFESSLADESMQYRETLASTVGDIARINPAGCVSAGLGDAVKARLDAIRQAQDAELESEAEALAAASSLLQS